MEIIVNTVRKNTLDCIQNLGFELELTFNCILFIEKMARRKEIN